MRSPIMTQPIPQRTDSLRRDVEASWRRFLDLYESLRPELYRYCRHLTRSPRRVFQRLGSPARLRGASETH